MHALNFLPPPHLETKLCPHLDYSSSISEDVVPSFVLGATHLDLHNQAPRLKIHLFLMWRHVLFRLTLIVSPINAFFPLIQIS